MENGTLTVRAPRYVGTSDIEGTIRQNSQWILQQLHLSKNEHRRPLRIGDTILFHGQTWTLVSCDPCHIENEMVTMNEVNQTIGVGFSTDLRQPTIHHRVYAWLRGEARASLQQLLERLATAHGYELNRVVIKEQMRRWGSCSTLGNINLNWRLIQAPPDVQQYVAIHELVHLSEMNHSDAFWNLVSQMMPNYQSAKAWLRNNGWTLYSIQPTFATFQM